jgi:hypothetical protein
MKISGLLLGVLIGVVSTTVFFYFMEGEKISNETEETQEFAESEKVGIGDPNISEFYRNVKRAEKDSTYFARRIGSYARYRRGGLIRNNDRFTQTIWFEYGYLARELAKFKSLDSNVSGVRVYLYAHLKGDSASTEEGVREVNKRFDLVFIGTKKVYVGKDTIQTDIIDVRNAKFLRFGNGVMGFNEGSLCPPPSSPPCKGALLLN